MKVVLAPKKRGRTVFVGAWVPWRWLSRLDRLVRIEDSDRSKIIRRAIEEKLRASDE